MTADEWRLAVTFKLIEPIINDAGKPVRFARAKANIKGKIEKGRLYFFPIYPWIRTSWLSIDAIAPPRGEYYEREIRRQYCGERTERFIDAPDHVEIIISGIPTIAPAT